MYPTHTPTDHLYRLLGASLVHIEALAAYCDNRALVAAGKSFTDKIRTACGVRVLKLPQMPVDYQ